MSFHINTNEIPCINNYSTARFHLNNIKPIQGTGRNSGVIPLAGRRAIHMKLMRRPNSIACRLYDTDCVIFYENGDVRLNYGHYNTVSTRIFINTILGCSNASVQSVRGGWRREDDCMKYTHFPASVGGPMHYVFEKEILLNSQGEPYNPELCLVHRVNRKALNSVRKLYAPFMAYAKTMIKIGYSGDTGLDIGSRSKLLRSIKERGANDWPGIKSSTLFTCDNADFLCRVMRHDDKADWAEALEAMAAVTMVSEYRYGYTGRTPYGQEYFYKPHHMIHAFMEAPKYAHRDQIFVRKELPLGEYKPDNNQKYIHSL